jgi:hypothetical protein
MYFLNEFREKTRRICQRPVNIQPQRAGGAKAISTFFVYFSRTKSIILLAYAGTRKGAQGNERWHNPWNLAQEDVMKGKKWQNTLTPSVKPEVRAIV